MFCRSLFQDRPPTLKPPILWSFLNSLPFLYQRRLGTGCPTAWQRNFTVLLAGTAWSCFSIFSGMTQRGADAGERSKRQCVHNYGAKTGDAGGEQRGKKGRLAYGGASHCWPTVHWKLCSPRKTIRRLPRPRRI